MGVGIRAGLGMGVGRCGQVWASLGRYGQGWAKMGRSGWVILIGWGWVIWLVGGCGCGCGWVWVDAPFSNTWAYVVSLAFLGGFRGLSVGALLRILTMS